MELSVDLKNCYGIASLEYKFDFSEKRAFSIYASNGIMKTSFAKTFMDISQKKEPKDEVYSEMETICNIKKDNADIKSDEIFVINSYEKAYKSDNIAKLLVNEDIKKQYDNVYEDIQKSKIDFLKKLIELTSEKKIDEIEKNISSAFFSGGKNKFFEALKRVEDEVKNGDKKYASIKYNEVFNDKTVNIINDSDFLNNLETYVEKYNTLLDKSVFFKKGVFNHSQATDISKQLEKNGFFQAEHSVLLNGKKELICDVAELEKAIDEEKNKILENEELKKEFDKLDKILIKNQDLKSFRDYLAENPHIITELSNSNRFKEKLWISYFSSIKDDFCSLLEKYDKSKSMIETIKNQANNERGDWHNVVNIFNKTFHVPFSLHIINQVDTILNNEIPMIGFKFNDKDMEETKLIEILSQGERRALYILNILFEIEVRKKIGSECVVIVDDIADSFDYKNKYAIVSYLKEMTEVPNFYMILLTHNFDFHRTVSSRLNVGRKNHLNAIKSDTKISLEEEKYQKNPLIHWRDNLQDTKKLIATIPMFRNLFEYIGDEENNYNLTCFLHIKENTKDLKIKDIKNIYEKILKDSKTQKITNLDNKFLDTIFKISDNINDNILDSKIILSIAIRLRAESFMIEKINDTSAISKINKNQTIEIFKIFKDKFNNAKELKILEKVNLMTPENIHFNSFMYEPIMDMGIDELKSLYENIKLLENN